ncbi:bL21 family ribosomal protein [uncultured Hyphomonas sp.]|uniref:bL21 family ribosomal protein n=1 Tax=uncultured Hyphomonas sp. TaxID=225298 RepID=UPI002AABB498|nr:bL21 family ribosomal protein [uncultured Hyphomonas sp.]
MIAVAKIGGHQAIVKVGDTLEVDKLSVEAGKKIKFDTLLVSEEDGKNFQIGNAIT